LSSFFEKIFKHSLKHWQKILKSSKYLDFFSIFIILQLQVMRSLRVTILLLFLLILSGCSESQGPHLTLISEQKEIRLGEFYTPY